MKKNIRALALLVTCLSASSHLHAMNVIDALNEAIRWMTDPNIQEAISDMYQELDKNLQEIENGHENVFNSLEQARTALQMEEKQKLRDRKIDQKKCDENMQMTDQEIKKWKQWAENIKMESLVQAYKNWSDHLEVLKQGTKQNYDDEDHI